MDLRYCIRSQTYDDVELNFTRREMKCKMIQIRDLTKIYPRQLVKALDEVSIEVEDGEFFGLLGPNGAGKTTLIKVIATLLLPSSGEILVDGELLGRNRVDIKSKIAIMTQEFSLRQDMNVCEIMEMQGRLYRVPMREIKRRTNELLEFCGLDSHRDKQCRKLSGGMKRRLMLCRALLTHPDILVLDEPTVGLDPISRRQMWDVLKSLNERGMTVVMTTHYIDEAQLLCGRVALLNRGKTVREDSPARLIEEIGDIAVDTFDKNTHSHFFHDREEALKFASTIENRSFVMRNTTLEDVFFQMVGTGLEER